MIEITTVHDDGRKVCHELKDGETLSLRGDEVEIKVTTVKKKNARAKQ
jgi:hypothetical protein